MDSDNSSSRIDLYHVNGLYFGFAQHGTIYDSDGYYRGWIEDDGSVWSVDGNYAGDLDPTGYVLRDPSRPAPPPRSPPRAAMPDLAMRIRPAHRGSYAPPADRVDALPLLEADSAGDG